MAASASVTPSGTGAPTIHGSPLRARSERSAAAPGALVSGEPGRHASRARTRAARTSRETASTKRRPSPQTPQRSSVHASGVVTVTPSESPPAPASSRWEARAWAKDGTSRTARPPPATASRSARSTPGQTKGSSVVVTR